MINNAMFVLSPFASQILQEFLLQTKQYLCLQNCIKSNYIAVPETQTTFHFDDKKIVSGGLGYWNALARMRCPNAIQLCLQRGGKNGL
mmetsp:Transcript_32482/g.53878  ORF Transcript_32482/g.53878 Transcript_32482/m.53878 type:complete len:88 (+) Transcript_32482:97-360(+)